jgi:hypothetical protein
MYKDQDINNENRYFSPHQLVLSFLAEIGEALSLHAGVKSMTTCNFGKQFTFNVSVMTRYFFHLEF